MCVFTFCGFCDLVGILLLFSSSARSLSLVVSTQVDFLLITCSNHVVEGPVQVVRFSSISRQKNQRSFPAAIKCLLLFTFACDVVLGISKSTLSDNDNLFIGLP